MSFEAIQSVTQAESEAKTAVANAELKAKQMLADAQSAGRLAVETAVSKAEGELQELNRQAGEKAVAATQTLTAELSNKKAALRAKAEARLEEAATLVVERIVNS